MSDQENTVIGQKRLAEADPFEDNDINGHGQNDSQELDSSRRANTKRKVDKNDGEGIALDNTQKNAEDKNIADYTDCKPDSGERPLQGLINTDVSREETFHKGKSEACSIDADATREDKEANPIRVLFKETEKGEVRKPNDDSHSKEEIQEEKEELQKNEEERKDVEVAGQDSKEDLKKENKDSNEQKYKKLFERKSPPSVQTFQQLSGAQNAFSGVSGTGFTISSFTFDTKVSSPGFGLTPKFGSFNAGSTSMASPSFTSSLGLRETMFAAKQANQNSPLSTTNSVSPFQLFGSPDAKQVSFSPSEKGAVREVTFRTGEENERTQFTAEASLFQYINSIWKERGKGEVRINIPTEDTGNARLVMRAKGNYRLILNASLYPEMKLTVMDIKSFTFVCLNIAAEAKEGLGTFALKFKDGSIAEEFKVILEAEKNRRSKSNITKHVEGLDTKVDS